MVPLFWRRRLARGLCLGLSAFGFGACFLVNPNITDFKFMLPGKMFTIDTNTFGLPQTAGTVPVVPCATDNDCMSIDPSNPTAFTCQSVNGSNECAATVTKSLVNPINLQKEDQAFADTVKDNPITMAQILDITFTADSDTLNFATPPITLYAAPATVMDPTSPMAQAFATIPSLPVGYVGTQSVVFTPNGESVLDPYIQNYSTTFNIIASSSMTFKGGDPSPTGQLVLTVNSDAQVSIAK
jgi:hypothetical protein